MTLEATEMGYPVWAWVPASVPGRPAQSGLWAPASTTVSQISLTVARVMSATPFPEGVPDD